MCRVEVMKEHHFTSDTAEKKIKTFFDAAAASRSSGGDADDADAEFGCVREGESHFTLLHSSMCAMVRVRLRVYSNVIACGLVRHNWVVRFGFGYDFA